MDTRDALGPVAEQRGIRRETGRVLEAEVQADGTGDGRVIPGRRAGAISAVIGRRGSGEDAHHHVESEEDLWQTNPYVENLLVLPEAPDGSEDLVKIHLFGGKCGSIIAGGAEARGERLLVNNHPVINQ